MTHDWVSRVTSEWPPLASTASLAEVWSAAAAAVQHTASSPTPTHRHTAALATPRCNVRCPSSDGDYGLENYCHITVLREFSNSRFLRESCSSIPGKTGMKNFRESRVPGKRAPGSGNLAINHKNEVQYFRTKKSVCLRCTEPRKQLVNVILKSKGILIN